MVMHQEKDRNTPVHHLGNLPWGKGWRGGPSQGYFIEGFLLSFCYMYNVVKVQNISLFFPYFTVSAILFVSSVWLREAQGLVQILSQTF